LGRPFLRTARALIDVHGEEMILRDGDERFTLNMRHDTSSYSNQPQKESINLINVFNNSREDFFEDLFSNQPSGNLTFSSHPELTSPKVNNDIFDSEGCNVLSEKFLDLDSTKDLHPPLYDNPLSGSTTYFFSSNPLLEEFADELPAKYDDNLQFDIESDLKEIEFLLYQDKNSFESDAENFYDDPLDSKREKIKESKLLFDELDLPCDFLPPSEYNSFISQDFSKVDALPSTNNEDKLFNPCILIQEKPIEIITRVVQDKKLAIFNAFLVLRDFGPPFYEPLFFKEVPKSKMLLPFSSENEEKVFKPGIHTSEKVHSSFISELSHQGYKVFKINQIFKSLMKIFLFYCGKDTHILAVPCHHFYPPLISSSMGGIGISGNLKTHAKGFCTPVFFSSASIGNHPRWENDPRKLDAAPDTLREGCTPKDLWKVCNDYGTVVDVFIPNKKSNGKRFAFVSFIKVINLDRLIENLNTIWIGRFHLFVNHVRFERPKKLVFPTYKDMPAAPNAIHDFVSDERIVWVDIEGIPLNVWSRETFMRIGKKWGDTLDIEDNVNSSFGRKRLCIKTKKPVSILESFKIIFKGKVLLVRAKELFTWNLTFLAHKELVYASEDESVHSPKKYQPILHLVRRCSVMILRVTLKKFMRPFSQHSEDPFKIYDILKKQTGGETREVSSSLSHPPGFTPKVFEIQKENDQGAEEFPSLVNAKMNILSLNIQGLGHKTKKEWIKELSLKNNINFMAIQETKTNCISHMDVKFMWGNSNYNYVYSEAVGNSGGILCVWEEYVSTLIGCWNGETIILGDFNEVRSIDERRGSCFNPSNAIVFDHFISSSGLVDVNLKGYTFTWSHPSGSKMSKLDRFLVSEGIFLIFSSITALCLDRHLSDHRPILLREVYSDFGPIPFRFYHSRFSLEGFDAMVEQTWRSFSHSDVNRMIRFKKKLQDLKAIIQCWVKDKRMHRRLELQRKLHDINQMEAKDSFQKSKIKGAI
nr:RNA-directed DNA polymerase, eukaryota [Tanacetum cinerariifolium]